MLVFELAIVLGLIVLNGFLAMSELALVSARRPLLEQMDVVEPAPFAAQPGAGRRRTRQPGGSSPKATSCRRSSPTWKKTKDRGSCATRTTARC